MAKFIAPTILVIGAMGVLAGCTSTEVGSDVATVSNGQIATGSISGSSKATLLDDLRRCGRKDVVTLTPVTDETSRVIAASFGNTEEGTVSFSIDPNSDVATDAPLPPSILTNNCDSSGWFSFTGVPAGDYFLVSYLEESRSAYFSRDGSNGYNARFEAISMMQRVSVVAGEKATVQLRPKDAVASENVHIASRSDI